MTAEPPAEREPDVPVVADVKPWQRWMYALVLVPVLTDIIETGGWPRSPREWFTECAVGLLIAVLVRRIRVEHAAVVALARVDGLTGLFNRRAFDEALAEECVRAARSGRPLTLVLFDLDNFKRVNDSAGHAAGDQVLVQFAQALRHVARAHFDRAFRIGGDEFALLLPGSSQAQAGAVVTRLRLQCQQGDPAWRAGPLGLSAGIVERAGGETPAAFVRRADAAMYGHKTARRAPA